LPGFSWVFTTTTPTGYATWRRAVGEEGLVRYFPLDLPWTVKKALRTVRPVLLVLVESELWPNLLYYAHRQGGKTAVVNGRLSDRTMRRARRVRVLFAPVFAALDLFLAQSPLDAERASALGMPEAKIEVTGNIKFDFEPTEVVPPARATLSLAEGPVLVAGSTHRGEEEILLAAFALLRAAGPAVLVLVPRHLERLAEIETLLTRTPWRWGRRSEEAAFPREILLVDAYGELRSFYPLATVAFVGGSLVPVGGHNPVEAAALGRPVLFGPHMENFRAARELLLAVGAAREVRSAAEIAAFFAELWEDPAQATEMGRRGREAIAANRGATARTAHRVAALMGAP
ncbi:MAG: 3-deoxy-D-manno-octulosonic acid transferase, partial [Firmicutes bacterium]|nr:3-deoxy-D-manno-octulosonic acid transferase [Bacillota bacterium]